MWDQKEFASEIESLPHVLRPANSPEYQPGRGWGVFHARDDSKVAVISMLGRTFMPAGADCPMATTEKILPEIKEQTPIVVIDFHAEATSEKVALGRYFAGKVSAVVGTHTHVPTADQQIFPPGTAFQCDLGMVGARESVLGRDLQPVLNRFRTGMPTRFTVNDQGVRLHGAVVTVAPDGRAQSIERIMRDMR